MCESIKKKCFEILSNFIIVGSHRFHGNHEVYDIMLSVNNNVDNDDCDYWEGILEKLSNCP